jgi:hypothetical protein
MWVANAQGTVPAAQTPYHPFNLEQLFAADPDGGAPSRP